LLEDANGVQDGASYYDFTNPTFNTAYDIKNYGLQVVISDGSGSEPPLEVPHDPTPLPKPGDTVIPPVAGDIVDSVTDAITNDLAGFSGEVVGAETASVKNQTNVFASTDSIRTYVTSAISVEQEVEEGGAVVLASDLKMPITGKSITGATQTVPEDFEKLLEGYSLNKYFGGSNGDFAQGNAIDILQVFKGVNGLFDYSPETGLVLKAVIVIVDGPAPKNDNDVKSPANNKDNGLKLAQHENENILYIFDGKTDRVASDPIALVSKAAKNTDTNTSGGGGCNTGIGAAAFALLAGAAAMRREKKNEQ
jgi:hypothetical protein